MVLNEATRRGGDDVAGGEVVELIHEAVEREPPLIARKNSANRPQVEQGRGEEACEMQPETAPI